MTDRIRDLREDGDLTQKDVAAALGISLRSYSGYETGRSLWPCDLGIKLARFYGVNVDYLLGLTNISAPYPRKR